MYILYNITSRAHITTPPKPTNFLQPKKNQKHRASLRSCCQVLRRHMRHVPNDTSHVPTNFAFPWVARCPSWWLSHPSEKNCSSNWIPFLHFSGWNIFVKLDDFPNFRDENKNTWVATTQCLHVGHLGLRARRSATSWGFCGGCFVRFVVWSWICLARKETTETKKTAWSNEDIFHIPAPSKGCQMVPKRYQLSIP